MKLEIITWYIGKLGYLDVDSVATLISNVYSSLLYTFEISVACVYHVTIINSYIVALIPTNKNEYTQYWRIYYYICNENYNLGKYEQL